MTMMTVDLAWSGGEGEDEGGDGMWSVWCRRRWSGWRGSHNGRRRQWPETHRRRRQNLLEREEK
ncbi:hypothetical protein Tco_1470917, partial [Tanacetum coccineum]